MVFYIQINPDRRSGDHVQQEANMKKCVCCNKPVTSNFYICESCEKEYNLVNVPMKNYPDWLKFLIKEEINKKRKERKIDENENTFTDLNLDKYDESDKIEKTYPEIFYDLWDDINDKIDYKIIMNRLYNLLTPREREILSYILMGYKPIEISRKLGLDDSRVTRIKNNIENKLKRFNF